MGTGCGVCRFLMDPQSTACACISNESNTIAMHIGKCLNFEQNGRNLNSFIIFAHWKFYVLNLAIIAQ